MSASIFDLEQQIMDCWNVVDDATPQEWDSLRKQ